MIDNIKSFFFIILCFSLLISCITIHLQTIITELNHAIGASGVVSQECKAIVEQYGETIIESLLAKVFINFIYDMLAGIGMSQLNLLFVMVIVAGPAPEDLLSSWFMYF